MFYLHLGRRTPVAQGVAAACLEASRENPSTASKKRHRPLVHPRGFCYMQPRRSNSALPRCGRGGIGRRAALRSLCRKTWKFESSRPHHSALKPRQKEPGESRVFCCLASRASRSLLVLLPSKCSCEVFAMTDTGAFFPLLDYPSMKNDVSHLFRDEGKRVVTLKLYDPNGNPGDVLSEIVHGGAKTPKQTVLVTRRRYFAIVDRILAHPGLVQEIVTEWLRQTDRWLAGASEPLQYHYPDPVLFQKLCDPLNPNDAALILAACRGRLEDQTVAITLKTNEPVGSFDVFYSFL